MKKLLSLLSVLTISGSAVPTTIAASPYKKEKNKINYSQTNTSKNLNRIKRENKNNIFGITKIIFKKNYYDIFSHGVVLDNKLYFGSSDKKVYEYNFGTNQQKVVITTSDTIASSGVVLDNKLYFGSNDGKVYEYDPQTNQQKVVITTTEEFNSFISFDNKLYFFSRYGKIYEYEPLKLIKSDVIDLQSLLNQGLFIFYKKQNLNSKIKNISNIDLSNLNFIETKAIKIFSKSNQKILLPFHNYHEEKTNISEKEIIYNSPDDEISEEISKSIEIQKGLSTTSGKTKSQTTTNSHNLNIGLSVSAEAEAKIFGIGAKINTTINTEYGYSNENSESIEVNLENSFNSSNTRKEEKKEVNKKTIKSQSIIIPPKKKLIYNSKIYKYSCEDFWNLTKKINGLISALIIDENNNSEILNVSIKDSMESLKENDILPKEFKINQQDNSITWTGKMATKYTCGFEKDYSSETKLVDV